MMNPTPMLDARLRIQMLGPQDPGKLATAEKSALGRTGYNEKVKLYHTAVDDLVNKAITSWDWEPTSCEFCAPIWASSAPGPEEAQQCAGHPPGFKWKRQARIIPRKEGRYK